MRYKVLTDTLCDGWSDCWHEDGRPARYETKAEAEAEILDHLSSCEQAGLQGYKRSDYRIMEIVNE